MMSNFGADEGSTTQYFCQETRTDENKERHANNFIGPQRFSCKGSDTDPAAYSAYRYDRGKTFSFKLDEAMAIIVEDDKTNEIAINTWFMPRYTKHK